MKAGLGAALLVGWVSLTGMSLVAGDPVTPPVFEKDIRPIFKAHCFHCHGEEPELKGGFDARLRRFVLRGGKSGPAIILGQASESRLLELIRSGEMPDGDARLAAEQVALVERWIAAGAPVARPEPETLPPGPVISEDERSHWSFQPIRRPAVPAVRHSARVRNPIDAFLLRRLEARGLGYSDEADRRTLIRRVYFDLLGLPPTVEAIRAFVQDERPDAYERLVDQVLASPHYGERWARHWLDVAGYADSEGYAEQDPERPYTYKYRDYVIRSFNDDKPWNQFIEEQLAGDELLPPPHQELSESQQALLVATGFLRQAPDGTGIGGVNRNEAANQMIADSIQIVSSSLLGLTVACAQCHDHRYDPVSQEDYYRFRAIFEPAYDWKKGLTPARRRVSLYTEADKARANEVEEEAKQIDAERLKLQAQFIEATFKKELAKLPEALRETVRLARDTPVAKRSADQKRLLQEHPSVNVSAGSLYLYDRKAADQLKAMAADAAEVRKKKPVEDYIRALVENPGAVPVTQVFKRGDFEQPDQTVAPAELAVIRPAGGNPVPENNSAVPTTGRRLAYARHLTSGEHPLTARVLVNRFWLHHFGRGLVDTPADFGLLGEAPSHPELLDWLAGEFMARDWSLKEFHRLVLQSSAYRQGAARTPEQDRIDPDNRLYGRMNLRRLDAETLRDALLSLTGSLSPRLYGEPVPVMEDAIGQFVLGIENKDGENKPGKEIPLGESMHRRSIYAQVRRSRPLSVMETFDSPRMTPNCEQRNASTAATQSLLLMNGEWTHEFARAIADRVAGAAGAGDEPRIRRAWEMVTGREPDSGQNKQALAFLEAQRRTFTEAGGDAAKQTDDRALASLCHALISANAFLYVD